MKKFSAVSSLGIMLLIVMTASGQDPASMAVNTWMSIPSTHMRTVMPSSAQYPNIQGNTGVSAVMSAWCGGALDTKRNRLIIWGGGHGDYYGNELYAFSVDSLKWLRLTDPCANPTLSSNVNADGTPVSRHTYNQIAYASDADRFFAFSGSRQGDGGWVGNASLFNFDTKTWTFPSMAGGPPGAIGACCAYDPNSKKVYFSVNYQAYGGNGTGLFSFNPAANSWTKHNSDDILYYFTMVVDPKRNLLLAVGNGNVYAYDLANISAARQTWSTTGGSAFISKSNVGLAYDPATDKIVGWSGGAVYALDPDTKAWTSYNPSGPPTPSGTGTYGRWQYVPGVNAFISANSIDDNVYFYKFSAGTGTGLAPVKVSPATASPLYAQPNPFNGKTRIFARLPGNTGGMTFRMTDINGRQVIGMRTHEQKPGSGAELNARDLTSGIYLLTATAGGKQYSTRLLLQK